MVETCRKMKKVKKDWFYYFSVGVFTIFVWIVVIIFCALESIIDKILF